VRIGVALHDRWLLARLLGTTDILAQSTDVTLGAWAYLPGEGDVAGLRERLAQGEGELAAAYRDGRALPFGKAAALALTLLEEVAHTLPPPARESARHRRSEPH
jgi:hypothetical protein